MASPQPSGPCKDARKDNKEKDGRYPRLIHDKTITPSYTRDITDELGIRHAKVRDCRRTAKYRRTEPVASTVCDTAEKLETTDNKGRYRGPSLALERAAFVLCVAASLAAFV